MYPKADKNRKEYPQSVKCEAIRLLQSGLISEKVGQRLNINGRLIRHWAYRNAIPLLRANKHYPSQTKQEAIELYQSGYSYADAFCVGGKLKWDSLTV